MQKILEVQKQIVMLNRHDREHVASAGDKAKLNASCAYCKQQYESENWNQISNRQQENKKKISTRNEMEREVEISDGNGRVIVPKNWAGKRVRISLVEDDQTA